MLVEIGCRAWNLAGHAAVALMSGCRDGENARACPGGPEDMGIGERRAGGRLLWVVRWRAPARWTSRVSVPFFREGGYVCSAVRADVSP